MEIRPEDTAEVAAGIAVGAPSLWIFFKKILVRNAEETTHKGAAEAQGDVIEILRAELRRAYEALEKSDARVEKAHDKAEKLREENETLQENLRSLKLRVRIENSKQD